MTRLISSSFALATLLLAGSCATKDNNSLLAPSPAPSQEIITSAKTKGESSAARAISTFVKLPKSWRDVGIGGAGSNYGEKIYAVETTTDPENVAVFNNDLNNPQWTKVRGVTNAVRITVDKWGNPWVLDNQGGIYRYDQSSGIWTRLPGQAKDIGAGGGNNGQGTVYIIGAGTGNRDIYAYNFNTNSWDTQRIGAGIKIDIDNTGIAWLVTENGEVYRGGISGWAKQSGQLKDIGATCTINSANATSIYGIGYGGTDINKSIYEYVGGNWIKTPSGEAFNVDVDQNGRPWVINVAGDLYYSY